MNQVVHRQLKPGVGLTMVRTGKFKSSYFGAVLLTRLNRESAAENALLPWVLRRGTRKHPDLQSLSAALDEMYGGTVEPIVTRKGETQCVGFAASFLDDAYALNGETILEPAAGLVGELLLDPYTWQGAFCPDYTAGEKQNLIDRIRAQRNDKRQYSVLRLSQEMCREEAFGIDRLGDEEHAQAITPQSLWRRYQSLLAQAQVELYYCGGAEEERVERALRAAFAALPESPEREKPACEVRVHAGQPRVVEECLDVTQGKLAMGFRTGGVTVRDEAWPAMLLLNAVFGGTSMSKLFLNVRERLSLCYFASSGVERLKGIMTVSSGIEFDKYAQARDEILTQLEACRRGEITEDELEGARRIVSTALYTTLDSQGRLSDYWLGQRCAGLDETPEQLCSRLERVTREQVAAAARKLELDTIYFLKGKEESHE